MKRLSHLSTWPNSVKRAASNIAVVYFHSIIRGEHPAWQYKALRKYRALAFFAARVLLCACWCSLKKKAGRVRDFGSYADYDNYYHSTPSFRVYILICGWQSERAAWFLSSWYEHSNQRIKIHEESSHKMTLQITLWTCDEPIRSLSSTLPSNTMLLGSLCHRSWEGQRGAPSLVLYSTIHPAISPPCSSVHFGQKLTWPLEMETETE